MVAFIGQGPPMRPFDRHVKQPNHSLFRSTSRFGGTLKNATHTSPRNPVYFNQSDDDFETPEVFPLLCAICIRNIANVPWAWHLRLRLGLALHKCSLWTHKFHEQFRNCRCLPAATNAKLLLHYYQREMHLANRIEPLKVAALGHLRATQCPLVT